jgi:hypothetical protein
MKLKGLEGTFGYVSVQRQEVFNILACHIGHTLELLF